MGTYKVSVIIATYNTANYLAECLDSIFSQTLRDIEVVLIDDGSTDDTESVIKKYKQKYENLVTRYQENQGAGIARNYGIALANGEYMVFMDPDDKYPNKDCLERMYLAAKEHDVLICGGNILTNDNGVIGSGYRAGEGDAFHSQNQIIDVKNYFYLYGHTRFLFETEFVKKNQILYANYRRFEDQVFTMKALGMGEQFFELNYPVYEYRINYKSLKIDKEVCLEILRGFRDTLRLICNYNLKMMFERNYESFIMKYMIYIIQYAFCGNQEFDQVVQDINELIKKSKWYDEKNLVTYERVLKYKNSMIIEKKRLEKMLLCGKPVIIYGAGSNTKKVILKYKAYMQNVVGIAVSSLEGNPLEIGDITVRAIEDYIPYKEKINILVTPKDRAKDEIMKKLEKLDFKSIEWIDVRLLAS